jgi:hypothetical protein
MTGLGLVFYDKWAEEIELSEFGEGDETDFDRRRRIPLSSKPISSERAGLMLTSVAHGRTCLPRLFATYLEDESPKGKFLS